MLASTDKVMEEKDWEPLWEHCVKEPDPGRQVKVFPGWNLQD